MQSRMDVIIHMKLKQTDNQNYYLTLNRKSQGQGHTERLQLKRSDQGQ